MSSSRDAVGRICLDVMVHVKPPGEGIPAENIASDLEMSKTLVREYVEIIEDMAEAKRG